MTKKFQNFYANMYLFKKFHAHSQKFWLRQNSLFLERFQISKKKDHFKKIDEFSVQLLPLQKTFIREK